MKLFGFDSDPKTLLNVQNQENFDYANEYDVKVPAMHLLSDDFIENITNPKDKSDYKFFAEQAKQIFENVITFYFLTIFIGTHQCNYSRTE